MKHNLFKFLKLFCFIAILVGELIFISLFDPFRSLIVNTELGKVVVIKEENNNKRNNKIKFNTLYNYKNKKYEIEFFIDSNMYGYYGLGDTMIVSHLRDKPLTSIPYKNISLWPSLPLGILVLGITLLFIYSSVKDDIIPLIKNSMNKMNEN